MLQTGLSYPLGRWADSFLDRHVVLLLGFLCLGAANVCCLFATTPMHMVGGAPLLRQFPFSRNHLPASG